MHLRYVSMYVNCLEWVLASKMPVKKNNVSERDHQSSSWICHWEE